MGSNPVNLGARFFLELVGLIALASLGWAQGRGAWRFVLAMGFPIVGIVLWSVFAVPGDPSRSATAVIPTPGIVRLVLELAFFGAAAAALSFTGSVALAWIYGGAVIAHYAASYDRIWWLIQQ